MVKKTHDGEEKRRSDKVSAMVLRSSCWLGVGFWLGLPLKPSGPNNAPV
jgi:hypothetical protein